MTHFKKYWWVYTILVIAIYLMVDYSQKLLIFSYTPQEAVDAAAKKLAEAQTAKTKADADLLASK